MARRLVFIILIFYGLFLVAGNWFVNSHTLASLLDTWDDGIVQYRWAATPFPGVVWVKDLSFWHQDKNIIWNTRAGYVTAVLWPPSLFKKKIDFVGVRVSDVVFHFHQKKKLNDAKKVAQGFFAPLVFPRDPRPKKPPSKTEDKWGISMKRVTIARLKEAWFDEYKYVGEILIHGGFFIQPDKAVAVGPADVQFSPGKFFLGPREMGQDFAGRIDYKMDAFDPDAPDEDIYHSISLALDIGLKTKTLSPANVYLSTIKWIRFQDGSGPVHLHLLVDRGVIQDGTHIEFHTPELAMDLGRFKATSGASIHFAVQKRKAKLEAKLERLRISDPVDNQGIVESAGLGFTAITPDLDLADSPFEEMQLGLKLAKASVPRLTALNRFFPEGSPLRFESGSAFIDTVLDGRPNNEHGVLDFKAIGARFRYGEKLLQTSVVCKMPFSNVSRKTGHFAIRNGDLKLTELQFLDDPQKENWWGEFIFPETVITSKPAIKVEGDFKVRMADTSPIMRILRPHTNGQDILSRFLSTNEVRSSGEFMVGKEGFAVEHFTLDSDPLKIKGFYSEKRKVKDAQLLIAREPFAVGIELKRGNDRIILQDAFGWFKRESEPRAIAE